MIAPAILDPGQAMHELITELYPICRSITGDGLRQTLSIIQKNIPLAIHEVPTGTPVFDWTVPREWNIRDAYVKNSQGERVIDFRKSNLHVVNYSVPIRARMGVKALKEHLHTLPDYPDWIPYRTSYYKESWGFCLSHREWLELKDGEYEVCIDSTLDDGNLSYGECYLKGRREDEVLISCHACHPSLCNDNLSGIALAVFLAKHLAGVAREYSYRFLFIPGTIGAITWLARNCESVSKIKHGLVLANLGDPGRLTYKKSRRGNAEIDSAVMHVLKHSEQDYEVIDFVPYGYDERQYCSPGFNLPVGCLSRTPWGRFPEYHTSADNLDFVRPAALADSLAKCSMIVNLLENNGKYINQNPYCEPQLGKRGLYRALGGQTEEKDDELAMLWLLNLSDGTHSLLDIAERAGLHFDRVEEVSQTLVEHGLLKACA
jgi:aminopeptidase-like protein